MKLLKKLNMVGAAHIVAPLLVVIGAGIIGTYMLVASHADSVTVGCSDAHAKHGKFEEYNCKFWEAAPVKDDYTPRHTVGTIHAGTNWILCQEQYEVFSTSGLSNNWWAYTEADNGKWGWVNAVYGSGGENHKTYVSNAHYYDGSFGSIVPMCYNTGWGYKYVPYPSPAEVYPTAKPSNTK